jgi:hypothetical protein
MFCRLSIVPHAAVMAVIVVVIVVVGLAGNRHQAQDHRPGLGTRVSQHSAGDAARGVAAAPARGDHYGVEGGAGS